MLPSARWRLSCAPVFGTKLSDMAKVIYAADQPPSFLAGWTSRLATFSVALLILTLFLHRVFSLPTSIALNIASLCFLGAALALLMAIVAGLDIWITGRQGAPRIFVGASLALALLAVPASVYTLALQWPQINDVTTDTRAPPEFVSSIALRDPGSNPVAYPGAEFAVQQQSSYPDIQTMLVPRPVEETYEIVLQAIAKLRHKTSRAQPPDAEAGRAGAIEFTDHTMVLGFADDIVIRVAQRENGSAVDIRSASRFGRNDFGHNAERIRLLLREIVGRLEASVPNMLPAKPKVQAGERQLSVKERRERDRRSKAERKKQRPAQ